MEKVAFTHKNGREQIMNRRYAVILQRLGRGTYMTRDMRAPEVHDDVLSALRAEYQTVVGKKAFHGWNIEQLREKIAQAQSDE